MRLAKMRPTARTRGVQLSSRSAGVGCLRKKSIAVVGWIDMRRDDVVWPILVPASSIVLVGVVLEVERVFGVAAAGEQVDVMHPTHVRRQVDGDFAERFVPQVLVKLAIAKVIGL